MTVFSISSHVYIFGGWDPFMRGAAWEWPMFSVHCFLSVFTEPLNFRCLPSPHIHSSLAYICSPHNNQSDILKAQICSCHPHGLKPFRDSHYSDHQGLHLWAASGVLGTLAPGLIPDVSDTYSHYSNHLHSSFNSWIIWCLCPTKGFNQAISLARCFLSVSTLHTCLLSSLTHLKVSAEASFPRELYPLKSCLPSPGHISALLCYRHATMCHPFIALLSLAMFVIYFSQ